MTTESELAWAAGFWDGEGCASGTQKCNTFSVFLRTVQHFTPECLHRFQESLGGRGYVRGPYVKPETGNQYWTWTCSRQAEIVEVMDLLFPFLSSPKQDQYERVKARRDKSVSHLPEGRINKPSKEELSSMYWDEGMNQRKIGERLGVSSVAVCRRMRRLGIPARKSLATTI